MDFLQTLGIEATNQGVSTGVNWLNSQGSIIDSYSPVDGKKIGAIKTTNSRQKDCIVLL